MWTDLSRVEAVVGLVQRGVEGTAVGARIIGWSDNHGSGGLLCSVVVTGI